MKCIDRYSELVDEDFDNIILKVRNGRVKCGKYAHLVKVDKNKMMKGKEFFTDGEEDNSVQR